MSGLMILVAATFAAPRQEPQISEQQMRDFLMNAKVIRGKIASKGITGVHRLTLSDGIITHDASFQTIDEKTKEMQFPNGQREINFRDSYKYNIAAYQLAVLLGIGDMMPVTIERKYDGETGSLSWWLPVKMDESDRLKKKIEPPDREAWNRQVHKTVVFSQLVYDTDRNLGNMLISDDWHIWMIDFSRAFRLYYNLRNADSLKRCDRQLLEKLRKLDAREVTERTKQYLTGAEIKGVMARRDRIVSLFEKLIREKGENKVLY
jgi:hypothetical protein